MTTPLTFTRAKAASRDLLCVSAIPDGSDFFEEPFTRLCRYDHSDPGSVKWFYDDVDFSVTSIIRTNVGERPYFGILSTEGDTVLLKHPPFPREKIPGAGIYSEDSKFWGRMADLRQIGDQLYACGDGGQIYRRSTAEFGKGRWEHMDITLLQDPEARRKALLENPTSPAADRKVYFCVNGPDEDDIYVCGTKGRILHWNGSTFTELPRVTNAALVDILIENPKTVWICGRDGTLLTGNSSDGFHPVAASGRGQQLFSSMTMHEGKIYLASNANSRGLFVYQGDRLEQVSNGLKPDILDVHTVDSVDGVLWVVGSKDILRFDGKTWERIDHVDNKPIR